MGMAVISSNLVPSTSDITGTYFDPDYPVSLVATDAPADYAMTTTSSTEIILTWGSSISFTGAAIVYHNFQPGDTITMHTTNDNFQTQDDFIFPVFSSLFPFYSCLTWLKVNVTNVTKVKFVILRSSGIIKIGQLYLGAYLDLPDPVGPLQKTLVENAHTNTTEFGQDRTLPLSDQREFTMRLEMIYEENFENIASAFKRGEAKIFILDTTTGKAIQGAKTENIKSSEDYTGDSFPLTIRSNPYELLPGGTGGG